MKKYVRLLLIIFCIYFTNSVLASTGNLSVNLFSAGIITGSGPGDTLTFTIFYGWEGDGPANNVQIKQVLPPELTFLSAFPIPTQTGNELTWDKGTVENNGSGFFVVTTRIDPNLPVGSTITSTATITSDVTDTDPEDNTSTIDITIEDTSIPDLWVMQFGLLESLESGLFLTTEKGITSSFEITYFNFSPAIAQTVTIVDSLPEGLEFVSASPSPSSVEGNKIFWNIDQLEKFGYGTITVNLRPTITGSLTNTVNISCPAGDKYNNNNSAAFTFTVVNIMQPIVLKPSLKIDDDPIIMGSNPIFEGLAKAGAKVTLYEGDSLGSFGDFSNLNPVELGSAIAGTDRKWSIQPKGLSSGKTYYLYLRAELNGEASAPFMNFWQPYKMRIEPILDLAGFDMDNFVVQNGEQTFRPGALGTSTSGTPDADIRIVKRFKAPPEILTDHSMWDGHKMKLVITEHDQTFEEWLPVSEVRPVGNQVSNVGNNLDKTNDYVQYDFIYVHKGFGPGAKIEVWCLPSYYDENGGLLISGLVWVKCHEILIDPAGYVYDVDVAGSEYEWPEIPPTESLIGNATVTCLTRTGDENWDRWNAEETGQINPQVTDETTEDKVKVKGYFAFYVPSGQYKVTATAPGYAEYTSPILTVIESPVFHNVGMKKVAGPTDVRDNKNKKDKPALYVLEQNYPNPFNPLTTISFYIPKGGNVILKIYDVQGKEVGTLINNEFRNEGRHYIQFDGSSLSSGIYLYKLSVANFSSVKKLMLIK